MWLQFLRKLTTLYKVSLAVETVRLRQISFQWHKSNIVQMWPLYESTHNTEELKHFSNTIGLVAKIKSIAQRPPEPV